MLYLFLFVIFGLIILFLILESAEKTISPKIKHSPKHDGAFRERRSEFSYEVTSFFIVLGLVVILLNAQPQGSLAFLNTIVNKGNFLNTVHLRENASYSFATFPPTIGPHYDELLDWQQFTTEKADEFLLHNMEEGGIVLWYRLGTEKENLVRSEFLAEVANSFPKTLIVPRSNLASTYMATTWNQRLIMNEPKKEVQKLLSFLKKYSKQS